MRPGRLTLGLPRLIGVRVALGLGLVCVLLLAGQLGQLAPVLRQAGDIDWHVLLPAALGVLLEPTLPIVCLLGCGLAYGTLRVDGAWDAALGLGHRPARLLAPALTLGLLAAATCAGLAHFATPALIGQVRGAVIDGLTSLPPGARLPLADGYARVDEDGVIHAVLGQTFLRAAVPELDLDAGHVTAHDAWIWSPDVRAHVDTVTVRLRPGLPHRALGQLGPPNSLPTARLGASPHHRFIAHRRTALPALAIFWAVLGGLLGARLGGLRAVLSGAVAVGLAYWILRTGELTARAGMMPAWLAAWAPVGLTGLGTLWGVLQAEGSGR